MKLNRKLNTWAEYLREHRERRFRSAREFCAKTPLGISYPQYSRYENGEQLPSLEQALSIGVHLGMPRMEMMLEWNRASLPDADTRAEVEALLQQIRGTSSSHGYGNGSGGGPRKSGTASVELDDVIVFNRSHLQLFKSDPLYRDIFTYVNCFSDRRLSTREIAQSLDVAPKALGPMLDRLVGLGVLLQDGPDYRAIKSHFYFPDDPDFFALRNDNFTHNTQQILKGLRHADLLSQRAHRGLVTRELTEAQARSVIDGLEGILQKVVAFPEEREAVSMYSVCTLVGSRFPIVKRDG